MDPVDRLILDESPTTADRLVVLDAPELVPSAQQIATEVRVWCDDVRQLATIDPKLRAACLDAALFADADLIWMRLPKALGALDEYAELIASAAAPNVQLVAGGRIKHLNRSMNEVLGSHFGQVSASLGRQKSRVLHAAKPLPAKLTWPRSKTHPDLNLRLWAHGATFAGTKVDLGTRLLVKHLKKVDGTNILDYGCGNGILAALIARQLPTARVLATDVSWAGANATRLTADANRVRIETHWLPNLNDWPEASLDTIITNPPFHEGSAKDSANAQQIFATSARLLRSSGEFWCVFNSHLPWKALLTRQIGSTQVVEQNTGYTLTRSRKR